MMLLRKYLLLAVKALLHYRQGFAVRAEAARYGFAYGISARERCAEIDEAVQAIEKMIKEPEQLEMEIK